MGTTEKLVAAGLIAAAIVGGFLMEYIPYLLVHR
jgi:hypothetical protein